MCICGKDPYCSRTINLILAATVLIFPWSSIRLISETHVEGQAYHYRMAIIVFCGYRHLSSRIHRGTQCTFSHDCLQENYSTDCPCPIPRTVDGAEELDLTIEYCTIDNLKGEGEQTPKSPC